jgi:hypothetical protein
VNAPDDEVLVILEASSPRAAHERIRSQYRVTQQVSPRVFVIQRPADPATLRALPGVLGVAEGRVPAELLSDLDETETLFAQAWSERASMRSKQRPGEGLPWDAPGFTPPDPPPDASSAKRTKGE